MIELLVASSVMFIVFAGVALVLIRGMAYLRSNESAMDAQRGALLTLNKISREVERTNMRYTYCQNGGLCFADPFGGVNDSVDNITEGFHSDEQGNLLFQRYIGYYLNNTTHQLYRREARYNYPAFGNSLTDPPPAGPDVCSTYGTPPMNVTWWADEAALSPRLISNDVAVFNVTAKPIMHLGVQVSSVVNVSLEMGDPARNNYNHYWFSLQTQFSPRNSD